MAMRYFLKIDGVTGDATDKLHKGWFAVEGYDIGVTTPFSSPAGLGVSGRTQFSPLSVDIHSIAGVSALLTDELTNKAIKSVELVGVETTVKGLEQTVYDLKLTNALLGSFENDPGSKGVETALTFHFAQATLTDHSSPPQTVAFDTTGNNKTSMLTSFMASTDLGSGGQSSSVFTPVAHQDHVWGG
ncbi:MAG TPA: type VI secretion system tube protein Hcp [Xanthobacteraceae bacterium]